MSRFSSLLFVALLASALQGCSSGPDFDRDGVAYANDECSDTVAGSLVDERGCFVEHQVQTEPDQDIAPRYQAPIVASHKVKVRQAFAEVEPECEQYVHALDGQVFSFTPIYFATNQWRLTAAMKSQLDCVMGASAFANIAIEVQGNTDTVGSAEYNLTLSQKRANSALEYLIVKGVDASQLSIVANGFDKPVAGNETESQRRQNRRTEFVIKAHQGNTSQQESSVLSDSEDEAASAW
ncbi:OmpA family protein [Motilimonas pumila]|nr:OmpA family protein [Motilimonas pumila]